MQFSLLFKAFFTERDFLRLAVEFTLLFSSYQVKKWSESMAAVPKGECPVGHRGEFSDILKGPQMTGLGHQRRI